MAENAPPEELRTIPLPNALQVIAVAAVMLVPAFT
jgi:hypothetical protein